MKWTRYLGCCSMNRYCDSWCTDVWRLGGETGGDLWGGMEEKETPASRRMCSSRQTRTGRCCERTASRVSFVLLRVGIVFRYRFVLPFALEFTWRFPVKCRCFPDIFIFFLDFFPEKFLLPFLQYWKRSKSAYLLLWPSKVYVLKIRF